MKNYVVYIPETGEIKFFWSCPPTPRAPEGLLILEVSDETRTNCADTHRVVNEELVLIE